MNQKKKKNRFFDLSHYQILPEVGRSGYCNYSEVVANYCWQRHGWLSINTMVIVEHKVNKFFIYFVIKNQSHFKKNLQRFFDNPRLLKRIEDYITSVGEEAVKHIDKKMDGKINDRELGNLLAYYYKKHQELALSAMTLRLIDRGVVDYFKNLSSSAKFERSIGILSAFRRKTFTTQERFLVLRLAEKIHAGSIKTGSLNYNRQIQKIYNSFSWLTLGYYNEPAKSLKDYEAEVAKLVKSNPGEILKKLNAQFSKEQEERNLILKKLPAKSQKVARIASEAAYLKDYFKFSVNKITCHGEAIFQEAARRTGFKAEVIKNLAHQDAVSLIITKKKLDPKKVSEYRRHSVFVSLTGKIHDRYIGQIADQFERQFLRQSKDQTGEFRGRIACRGLVKGRAKIVHSPQDFNKVNKGEIIIVMNTGPDFVPLLRRVGAIVAEEGGITAHVSVISREMNVPCIVGVPGVTKNIKDGDYLEVDANKGLVKFLKNER